MSQGSLYPKIRFIGQKTDRQTDRHTDTQTDTKVNTEDTLSGFQDFFLQPIIKDRSKITLYIHYLLLFIFDNYCFFIASSKINYGKTGK